MHKEEEDEVNKHLSQLSVPSLAEAGAVSMHRSVRSLQTPVR